MPKTCPQCQGVAADGAAFCPTCGAALATAPAGTTAAAPPPSSPPPPPPPAAPPGTPYGSGAPSAGTPSGPATPAFSFDARRLALADWIAGIASVVLFISLFLSWFGVSVIGISVTESGLSAHGFLYIVMIICIVEVAYLVLRAGWETLPVNMNLPHLTVMLSATVVNLVLVFIAFIDKPGGPGVGWEFGAVLALIAAAVATVPYAIPQVRTRTM
jgi:hypothetical protein